MLRTGIRAFADRDFYGTSTTEVAEHAGISQAYVYRLFPDKEALFGAVVGHMFDQISDTLKTGAEAAVDDTPDAVLDAMSDAYAHLIGNRDLLLLHLHAQTAAASEPAIRDVVHAGYSRLIGQVRAASGADDAAIQRFFALGFLCHVVTAIEPTDVDTQWANALAGGLRHY